MTSPVVAIEQLRRDYWPRLASLPSTNARIVADLVLASFYVLTCLVADMISHPVSEATQLTVGGFIAAMLGISFGQFNVKRKTDADYVAAKGPTPPAAPAPPSAASTTVNVGAVTTEASPNP